MDQTIFFFKIFTYSVTPLISAFALIRDWKFSDKRTRKHHLITKCLLISWLVLGGLSAIFYWSDLSNTKQEKAELARSINELNQSNRNLAKDNDESKISLTELKELNVALKKDNDELKEELETLAQTTTDLYALRLHQIERNEYQALKDAGALSIEVTLTKGAKYKGSLIDMVDLNNPFRNRMTLSFVDGDSIRFTILDHKEKKQEVKKKYTSDFEIQGKIECLWSNKNRFIALRYNGRLADYKPVSQFKISYPKNSKPKLLLASGIEAPLHLKNLEIYSEE